MTCQICGEAKPTILAEFSGNIGALIMRFERSIRANMCRLCVHKQFWKYTAMNFFLGWWGIISFFVNAASPHHQHRCLPQVPSRLQEARGRTS
jgi:hypothetical protein